jgi:hypothetical protein
MNSSPTSTTARLMAHWKALWEDALDDQQKKKIKMMLDNGSLLFFFRHNKEIYGASEGSRVTFAKMKDPDDEDHTPGWMKEAMFTATNLTKLGQGEQVQTIFSEKDLKSIDVLSKDEAYFALEEFFEKEKEKA